MYEEIAEKKFKELQNKDDYLILAIESSCDETSAAVTRGRDVLSLVIASYGSVSSMLSASIR